MTRMRLMLLALLVALSMVAIDHSEAHHGNMAEHVGVLQIKVLGLQSSDGAVIVGLYDNAAHFAAHRGSFQKVAFPITDQTSEWVLEDIPSGDYAVMLYHDANGNHRLDRSFFGTPKEPYGFSNNVRTRWGIPSYEEAKFTFEEPMMTLEIELHNFF